MVYIRGNLRVVMMIVVDSLVKEATPHFLLSWLT